MICSDIPDRSEVILYHGITDVQKNLYKAILCRNHGQFDNYLWPICGNL
jgi:hypothetical protein